VRRDSTPAAAPSRLYAIARRLDRTRRRLQNNREQIMDYSATSLWGLLFGSIGLGYALYGRKQHRPLPFGCGLLLIAFPYFVVNTTALVAIGVALSALPYFVAGR
jgi:hypothetical protein